jgi:hypothetical protein
MDTLSEPSDPRLRSVRDETLSYRLGMGMRAAAELPRLLSFPLPHVGEAKSFQPQDLETGPGIYYKCWTIVKRSEISIEERKNIYAGSHEMPSVARGIGLCVFRVYWDQFCERSSNHRSS